ncbi:SIALI-17 repeat-containing surface protein [uncultured Gemella sp.]|uniref:SIALI-17 repeat-containing surface protein n=1 Tax=uncultured Gemella sp. TaxID=254352 RepID=UPI0025FBACAA|nr:SIALI-17 repeat-containing surface protein [uncultured Gemella sp.]
MKINNFTKCTLAVALGFGLNSLTVAEAADNNAETPASDKINKSFIEQFPFAEKFTDKDGITAVRMKSPDVPLVNKEKGYSREIVRVINYKQGTDKTVINRIYQYVRFYGAPVHEVPKDSPVNDVPEYNGGANPIDPPVLEKPEYNGGAKPIDPPVLEKPEFKVPNTPEKPKTPEVSKPEKPKTDIPTNLPKPKENNPQNNNRVLPNTGLESSSSMAIIGTLALSIIGLAILKRRNN